MRKLQCFEVVKIFDHILFLAVSQFDNISRRKLIRIVSYGLVNHLGCYSIQFSNISVKDDLRIPDDKGKKAAPDMFESRLLDVILDSIR